ncbi:MAG TPA: hypothetical protein VEQ60_23765 [Longimicrobium sp.]|nr:hypothetical protein [Longimicrobium sp.]
MPSKLRVEFSGLCLYVYDAEKGKVGVLMPDCRADTADRVHPDTTEGAFHAGYLRFNLANLEGVPQTGASPLPAGSDQAGPEYEVVHRFHFQQLEFVGLADEAMAAPDLGFPDFGEFAEDVALKPGMFGPTPPEELLMRAVLEGGAVQSARFNTWKLPDHLKPQSDYGGTFARRATWTRTLAGETVTVRITPLHGEGDAVEITLRPAGGEDTILLRVANLCEDNPLEWPELKDDAKGPPATDDDFKWLYRLLDSTSQPFEERVPANAELPVPVLVKNGQVAGVQGCLGGMIAASVS